MIYLRWIKQGVNSLKFQLSLGSIVFHLGLGGKFQLCSWHDSQEQRNFILLYSQLKLGNY